MTDLNKLSNAARSAAMRGGTEGWGQFASSSENVRYAEPLPRTSRKRCHCGCGQRKTHAGMANGMCLTSACELAIRRWVKTGHTKAIRSTPKGPTP